MGIFPLLICLIYVRVNWVGSTNGIKLTPYAYAAAAWSGGDYNTILAVMIHPVYMS